MAGRIYLDNDNLLTVSALKNANGGALVTDATVTATLYDASDAEVTGQVWPLIMGGDGAGNYSGQLQDTLNLTDGGNYTAVVSADGVGLQAQWRMSLIARKRTV